MPEITKTFRAVDDDGQEYVIHELTTIIDVSVSSDPSRRYERSARYETAEGHAVDRIEKGVYQLYRSRVILRSEDPSAP
jgi:hypothetical protein